MIAPEWNTVDIKSTLTQFHKNEGARSASVPVNEPIAEQEYLKASLTRVPLPRALLSLRCVPS